MKLRRFFQLHARRPASRSLIELDRDSVKKLNTLSVDSGAVDRANGIVRGVSVITSGVTARGHRLEIDDTTVQQIYECGTSMEKVPVKLNHKSGIVEVIGFLQDFYLDKKKLRADWHLLKEHDEYSVTLEKAERMPGCFGLSAAFMGDSVTSKGEKVVMEDDGKQYVKLKGGGKRELSTKDTLHARCDELVSVDCVATPAANPDGLLDANFDNAQEGNTNMGDESEPTLKDVMAAINKIGERQDASEQFQRDLLETINGEAEEGDEEGEDGEEEGEEEGDGDEEEGGNEEGSEEGAGVEGQMAGAGAELSGQLGKALTYLESRFSARQKQDKDDEIEFAVGVLRDKIKALAAENEALHELATAGNGKAVRLSAEDSGSRHMTYLSGAAPEDEYEERVAHFLGAGKKQTEAIQLAMKEDGGSLYRDHMKRLGILK